MVDYCRVSSLTANKLAIMVVAGKKIKHRVCNLYDRKPHNVAVEAIVPIISSVATIADVADMILNMVE